MNQVNFYGRPDADMLEIGNGDLTPAESRSHFAFWAAMKSPLLIGADLSRLSQEHIRILKNDVLLAFNQDDVYERPATPFKWDWTFSPTYPAEFWSGRFQQGILILLLNVESAPRNMSVNWAEVPQLGDGSFWVTDGWTGESLGCLSDGIEVNVETHDTTIILVGNRCWSAEGRYRPMWWKS
jgi:alpha-galactosidase